MVVRNRFARSVEVQLSSTQPVREIAHPQAVVPAATFTIAPMPGSTAFGRSSHRSTNSATSVDFR